ncbi:uncharacterized protein LOC106717224 [Papilio machaon]|uniref:uncharacterized protein LOC106717224 n=1 Tax=Papilio machaon TaxID=76193 RepID=UPI001E666214|nr:uncharacterized protein LOC106717224 [Papilio machaon]
MNTGEDEPSTGLNGRLRPRKSNHSPQSNQISRKSENKTLLDKPKRTTNLKILPNKTDDLVNKSDNTIPKHFCPYCDKTFISKQTALKHVHLIHISSSKQDFFFDCLFCNHVEHNSNIIRHMVDSHPNQYFACLDCHTRFPSTSDVAQHKLNVCEKQKLSYRSKLRQKSLESKKSKKLSKSDATKSILSDKKDFAESFNGIVISCELKPTKVHDDADIEDNITTNLILPSNKGISHKAVMEKNAIIVLDDIQWNKRIPSNFSFHNTDADQILTRLGVVHRSPRTGESTKKEWTKPSENGTHKFEKCFDTSFYMQVTSNVQENLLKHLDGSFNDNPEPDSIIKTRKSKDCVPINTAEGFPILLAGEQYSRNLLDGFVPRAIAPKHKWKWDSADNGRAILNMDQLKRDSHLNNCIITYVSNLDIWTQLCMRKKFEDKFSSLPLEKKTEKRNTISKELKEILESKEIPTSSTQGFKNFGKPTSSEGFHFPAMLGLTPTIQPFVLPPAVLSGESVRPRCYVCCACGAQTHDSRALSSHISTEHPNAQIEHYEIVGEPLLNADIFKHLYVPPSQIFNRTRPQRGFRECTKCKKSVTLEDLHQHMLDCAGDTPTVRRKCRYRPFGVRKRRPRLPDNRIRKKMRKDIRTGQRNDKNILRPRPKTRSEVGDAETIRKMLADLPAKRHRVTVNPLNSFPRRKYDRKRNKIMTKKHSLDQKYMNIDKVSDKKIISSRSTTDSKDSGFNNDDDDEDDNLPLRPKTRDSSINSNSNHKKDSLKKKAILNRPKRKPNKELKLVIENGTESLSGCIESTEPDKISLDNTPNRVDLNSDPQKVRGHSNREGSNNRESQQSGSSGPSGNSNNSNAPTQNVPLKHSIASLTADSETHDKAVQFHRLFLVQQECNNGDEHHFPSDPHILFENQAVVTKLDKPPLHFNQNRASDFQYSRKNKLSKPRKGLNDCIAMLKNKLTPNIDSDIPGHVSVQCGSDEPIELEPIYIEQGFHFIGSKHGHINKEISQPHISADDKPSKTSDGNDYKNSHESIIDVICPDKDKVPNYHIQDRLSDQCQDKIKPRENNAPNDVVIPPSQLALLPPPRNTVIHKSPKMSGNQMQQEEEKMISNSQIPKSNKNIDQNGKAPEIPSMMSKDILKTIIRPGVRNSQYCNAVTKKDALVDFTRNNNLTNLTPSNDLIPLDLNLAKNLTKSQNQYVSTKRTEWNKRTGKNTVEQNGESSRKINLQHASDKYNDIPLKILPAHTSASFEPLSPAPLDLSGKSVSADTLQNSSRQDRHTLIMNRYDDYETLDLSNKNTDDNETLENSTVVEDVSLDVVVDLSIKQTPQSSSQSSPTNLSTKSPENNENLTGTAYDKIHEDFPTDLSLRKRARASSINILPQECVAIDYIQDLSNHKPVHKGKREENLNVLDHINNETPRDLSNKGLEDNSIVTNLLTNETDSRELNVVSNTLEASEKHENGNIVYDNTAESLLSNSNEDINLNVPKSDSNYILPSTNTETTISHSQNKLSPFKDNMNDVNSPDINETIGSGNLPQSNTEPSNIGERNETINSQSSQQPFIETICFIVPKDQLPYEIENSTLNITITTNGDSMPLYQSLNCNGTTQEARNNPESTTSTRYSLENVSVPISTSDLDETNFSNNPEEKISSSTSVYNEVETDRDDKINYNPNNGIDVNKNEKSLILRNNNSAETNRIAEYTSELSTATPDKKYDLTKEIINCETEQDTETARKIAMLPQELVEILGTMPIDHRNQLLNVLPQYVSTSASTTGTETRKCLIKKQQALSKERSYDERLSDIKNVTRADESDKTLYPTSTVLSPESVPQSVILKAPVVLNENYQKTSKTREHEYSSTFTIKRNSTPVHKRQPKLVTFEDEANVVIDLTHDENVQEVKEDIQIIESHVVPLSHDFDKNQNIDTSLELLKQKGSNDQTANLRAVRIKTTYERNKLIPLEGSLEYKSFYKNTNDKDQIIEISGYEDVNAENNGIKTYNEDLRIAADRIEIPLLQCIDSNKSFDHLNESITLSGPLNVNESILVNSTVILTPISNKENSIVLPDITFERDTNRQSNDLSNSMDEEITLLDTTDAHDNSMQIIPINGDALPTPPKVSKEKVTIGDEDSEDDVTLAVIVKKKQQMQLPASCDNIPLLDVKCTMTSNNNVKQDKKTTKSVLKDKGSKQLPNKHLGAESLLSATFDDIDNLATVESEMRNGKHRSNSNILNTCKNSSIEMVVSNCKLTKNIRSRRVSSKFSKAINQRNKNGSIISHKKGGNMTIKTKDLQKVYKEDTLNIHTVVNGSTLKLDTKDCIDKTKLTQISQQTSKESIQKLKGKRGKPRKKKCFVRNCILHSYMGNLYRKSLYNSKQRIAPHLQAVCTGVPISKIKELTRLKQKRNKQSSEIIKSQQTSIGIEKINPLPLRRSRRGKSMFVDNNSAQSYVSHQNDKPSEQKVPLTKKQLIFSKLLLDEERILHPQTDEVIAKAPVILIKDVSLSGHTLSSISQSNKNTNASEQSTVNSLIQDKRSKRKKSPQSKQKYKKLKSVDGDTEDNTLSTINIEIQKGKTEKQISQEDELFLSQNALSTSLITEQNKNNVESITNGICAMHTVFSEKRKICTSTSAEINRESESKKSKLTDDDGTENKKLEHVKQNVVENWRKSRNDAETKNTTCYNSHTAMRRTRSKSVVVKSSTSLYDPYDIDLEDMAEKDEPFGRLLTSNKAFSKSGFIKDQAVKKINKNETSVGVNTEPIIEENKDLIPTKKLNEAYSKEDTSDSDDSAKSDVPLQKYVEEREKKKSRHNSTTDANSSAQDSQKKKKETQIVASTSNEQQSRNDQFMESFGFFSERKPRKSNLIAAKKISETFNAIEADDTNDDEKVQPSSKQQPETTKPNDDENDSAEPTQAVTKKPAKRGRKKAIKPVTKFCVICNKDFKRPDNYLRHQITLLHISKLSEIEMKVKTTPVFEEPNYLIPYKQQLDHLKMIGMTKKKRSAKPPSKAPLPTLGEILAKVNKKVRNQQLSRRNLSRDEALFIDCCELLQESHKPELSNNTEQITTIISTTIEQTPVVSNNPEHVTTVPSSAEQVIISNSNDEAVTSQNNEQVILLNEVNTVVTERAQVIESDKENNTISEEYELRSDGDVDSITAKNILESEEVRNLENDLLSGLKEAAAQSLAHASSNFVIQQTLSGIQSDQNETEQEASSSPVLVNKNCENIECHEVVSEPPKKIPKPRRKQEVTDSMYPNVFEDINMFEDKFDKIKRKCRSQAAAAKHAQPVVEPITSQKGKKKSENKKGNEPSKEDPCHAIPTKGALKGFDGLKVSTPTSGINTSAIIPPSENTSKGKKKNNSRNHKDRVEIVTQSKPNQDHRLKTTQTQKIDVYEFMDSEDTELFDFRPSTLMERFKNNSNRDMPNTSKFVSTTEEVSCESGSDGDDFVYDDYVCSDDETENSIMSCELGNSKTGIETKSKSNSPLKRKDAVEKSAVMGKIFKHNAVRTERKNIQIVDNARPQANLDQLFDSLLVAEPGVPSLNTKLPKKESREQDSTPSTRHESKSSKKHGHSKRHESSKKHEISKKHDTSKHHDSFKKHEASKKYELSKIHESCKIEEFSKKHESSHKYDSSKKHVSSKKHTSPKKHASSKKHESSKKHGYSRKHESSKKHQYSKTQETPKKHETSKEYQSTSHRKHQSASGYDEVFQRKDEDESPSKHGVKMSKQYSGKSNASASYDTTNIDVYNDGNINSVHLIFNCKPSTSKDYNYESVQEIGQSSPKKHISHKRTKSSLNEYHSSTPKSLGVLRSCKESFHQPTNIYLNVRSERRSREITSSNRDSIIVHNRDSGPSDLYTNHFGRYTRNRSTTPEIEEDNDSNSDIMDTLDEATSDDAGVARQRARRKCTVGKQNVLAETWSSESEPESGPPRPNSAESEASGGVRKKVKKKRDGPYGNRRGVSRQMPILRQDLESRVALFKRTTTSSTGRGIQGSSSGAGPSSAPVTSIVPSSSVAGGSAGPSGSSRSHHSRSATSLWSTEGDEEQEHHQQHGWIVGVSHKKLVTMLAHAKGRKRNHDDKRHNVE